MKNTFDREEVRELIIKVFADARQFNSIDGLVDIDQVCDLPKDLQANYFDAEAWLNTNFDYSSDEKKIIFAEAIIAEAAFNGIELDLDNIEHQLGIVWAGEGNYTQTLKTE